MLRMMLPRLVQMAAQHLTDNNHHVTVKLGNGTEITLKFGEGAKTIDVEKTGKN